MATAGPTHPGRRSPLWAAVLLAVAVPLALDPAGLQRFLPVKFALVVAIVPAGLAAAAAASRLRLPQWRWWAGALAALTLATATSVAPVSSLIGAPQRNLGLVAWATFAGAFFLGASVGDDVGRRAVVLAAVAASIPISLYGLAQVAGLDPLDWQPGLDLARARSTLGNAGFLGAYLVVVLPLAVDIARRHAGAWRLAGVAAAVLGSGALLATRSRGAWIGFAAAAAAVVLAGEEARRLRMALVAAAAAAVAVLAVSPLGSAVADSLDLDRGTVRGRLAQWELTTELIADRPFTGWGPDTYRSAFLRVVDDDFERGYASDTLHDRAHNLVLDTAATAGLVGVIALGGLVGAVGLAAWRGRRASYGVALLAGLAGYLTQLQFSFQEATLDAVVWLLAGVAVAGGPAVGRARGGRALAAGLAVVAVLALGWAGRDVIADRELERGLDLVAAGAPAGVEKVGRAAGLVPERFGYRQAAARTRLNAGGDPDAALADVERALDLAPGDGELLLDRAVIVGVAATTDVSRAGEAEDAYRRALAAYPASGTGHLGLGVTLAQQGRTDEAEVVWIRAAALMPRDGAALVNLGLLYEQRGDAAEARDAFAEALDRDPASEAAAAGLARLGP